jgi:putative drug exporter of the RND superfamily
MSTALYRWGRLAVRHRRMVLAVWVVGAVLVSIIGKASGGEFHDSFSVPGVESQQATDLLKTTFPAQAGSSAQVVLHADKGTLDDGTAASAVSATVDRIKALPHVVGVENPLPSGQVSSDRTTALMVVRYDKASPDLGTTPYHQLKDATASLKSQGVQVEFGGDLPQFAERQSPGSSEAIGLLAAVVILLFAFGSLIAMGLPIATALFGLVAGFAVIMLLAAFVDVPSSSEAIATMVGLGVGIDYSLFIITRHRAGLRRGLTVEDAAGRAIATAGQAVLIAGVTVVIALFGLAVAGISLVTFMGIGAAIVVAVMVLAALSLLPALIGFAGHNIDRFSPPGIKPRVETGTVDAGGKYHGWARWSHHVARKPVVYLVGSLALILLLAVPALDLRLGQTDASQNPTSSTLRRSYDLLAHGFGPGFNGPLILAVDVKGDSAVTDRITAAVKADPDVASVGKANLSPDGSSAVIQVEPRSAPQDAATSSLVHRLRNTTLPGVVAGSPAKVYVGGQTAVFIDLSERVAQRLPWFIGAVISLSFLLLLVVFRSILVPVKAAVMNVLSIGAAYGVMVAVFQKGWGASLFGVHQSLPIISFIPMFMFAILFGLSMDYEVFLLSRIREEYLVAEDNTESIVVGITTTARVITSAALVMIAVFLSFVLGDEPTVKMIGLGLATAILVDATLVRMVLVPSTMKLLGRANWWLPGWLDRLLPNLDIEGETKLPPEELEQTGEMIPQLEEVGTP